MQANPQAKQTVGAREQIQQFFTPIVYASVGTDLRKTVILLHDDYSQTRRGLLQPTIVPFRKSS